MRRVPVLLAMLLLSACKQEPTFDERYDAAKKTIGETAAAIDRDIDEGMASAEESARSEGNAADEMDAAQPARPVP